MNFADVQSITIPEGDVKRVAIGGATVWQKPNPLPYDAEVEWVATDGSQFVDTGLNYFADFEVDMLAAPDYSNVTLICGSRNRLERDNATRHCIRFRLDEQFVVSDVSIYERHVSSLRTSPTLGAVCLIDGIQIGVFATRSWAQSNPMRVSANNALPSPTVFYQNTIYSLRLWDAFDTLVRDFVPVRVGTVGYLYDRANPTGGPLGNGLYGSATSTPLVAGPDKNGG